MFIFNKIKSVFKFLSSTVWLSGSVELSCHELGMHTDKGTNLYFFLSKFQKHKRLFLVRHC